MSGTIERLQERLRKAYDQRDAWKLAAEITEQHLQRALTALKFYADANAYRCGIAHWQEPGGIEPRRIPSAVETDMGEIARAVLAAPTVAAEGAHE